MIANPITGEVQSLSTHPNDNWMGAPWLLVPLLGFPLAAQLYLQKRILPYCVFPNV